MDTLLEVGLSNAVAALGLALVAAAAGLVCRRPALVHALWLLVLLKLVTPPLARVPVPWPAPAEPAPVAEAPPADEPREEALDDVAEAPPEGVAVEVDWPEEAAEPAEPPAPMDLTEPTPEPASAPEAPPRAGLPWWARLLVGVWLAGSAGWFVLAGGRVWRFHRGLAHARPAPEALRRRVERLARRVGLARVPSVWLIPGRVAPMVWCFVGPPRLLLPAGLLGEVGDDGRDTLILHELAHLRRRDHWVRWLEFVVLGLYWWHPAAWYARRELHEAEEQCCDAWVVSALPGAGRAYATALVDTLDFLSEARPATPALASGIGRVTDLKRRLTMILRGDTPRGLSWPASLAVCGLGALLLPLLPTLARAQAPVKGEKEDVLYYRLADDRGGDLPKAKAELERLEADLARKMAELKAAKAKLEAAEKASRFKKVVPPPLAAAQGGPITIRIEITGADAKTAEVLKEVMQKLEKELPGKGRVVLAIDPKGVEKKDARTRVVEVKPPTGPTPAKKPLPPGFPSGGMGGFGTPPGADKRTEALEKKLDAVLKELEALRKEMKGRSGGRGFSGGGTGSSGGFSSTGGFGSGGFRPGEGGTWPGAGSGTFRSGSSKGEGPSKGGPSSR